MLNVVGSDSTISVDSLSIDSFHGVDMFLVRCPLGLCEHYRRSEVSTEAWPGRKAELIKYHGRPTVGIPEGRTARKIERQVRMFRRPESGESLER